MHFLTRFTEFQYSSILRKNKLKHLNYKMSIETVKKCIYKVPKDKEEFNTES